jgi:hypothetical protein
MAWNQDEAAMHSYSNTASADVTVRPHAFSTALGNTMVWKRNRKYLKIVGFEGEGALRFEILEKNSAQGTLNFVFVWNRERNTVANQQRVTNLSILKPMFCFRISRSTY